MGCVNSSQQQGVIRLTNRVEPASQGVHNDGFCTGDESTHRLQTEGGGKDTIAIVGIGCRSPGADNIREFWRVLVNGECHVTDVPPNRWNASAYFSEDPTAIGKAYVMKGGFINDVEGFDNGLYGINDYEASQMDPQQCLLLECTTMALQDAGITTKDLAKSNTGVYVGAMNSEHFSSNTGVTSKASSYTATSSADSLMSGRLSFVFNLLGPSLTIDSACSSSLIAVHLACQAIRTGDCDQAIAGGVNCMQLPDMFIHLSKARMISPSGLCHTFSDQADGYTRAEGCGVLILKRLSDALRDGDHIWATVCTGTNQDGRTVTPITAPSGEQQKKLLQSVYDKFQVDANKLDYIEAHGTGTPTGDPVEVNSFGAFLKERGQLRQRYIGSVKTNIAHPESASGVLSIIKLCLMMKYNTIVPSLHCDVVNPAINLDAFRLVIPKTAVPWSTEDKLCCCNSFGFGGSNGHAILQSVKQKDMKEDTTGGSCIVCFSGRNIKSLKGSLEDLIKDQETSDLNIHDVSYTSTERRDHHLYRAAFLVEDMQDLRNAIGQRLSHDQWPQPTPPRQQKVVFVFCGMGTSWEGMCRQLLEQHQVFKDTLLEVEKHLSAYVSWSLTERLIQEDPSKDLLLDSIAVFACQIGLVEVWRSLGIRPGCVVGQSIGEVAAAYTAGCFSLADAVEIVFHRSKLLAEQSGGAMIVVLNVEVDNVRQALTECERGASISQEYSSKACAISAPSDIMPSIKRSLQTKLNPGHTGMQIKDLNVHVAYHSPHVNHCAEKLSKQLKGMTAHPPSVHMHSTVTGSSLTTSPDAKYWAMNLRDPVLLKQAVADAVKGSPKAVFLEIGPQPVLKAHLKDMFPNQKFTSVSSMLKPHEMSTLLKAVITLYEEGLDVTWTAVPRKGSEPTKVPRYCFNKRYQSEKTEIKLILQYGLDLFNKAHLYTFPIRDSTTSFLLMISPMIIPTVFDHMISGKIIVPGAFLAEASLAVARYCKMSHPAISIEFEHATAVKNGEVVDLVAEFEDAENSTDGGLPPLVIQREKRRLASAQLKECGQSSQETVNLDYIRSRCKEVVDKNAIYSALGKFGFQYGPAYSLLERAYKTTNECLACLEVPSSLHGELPSTTLHPSILDCMLQTSVIMMETSNQFTLPKSIGQLVVYRPVERSMYVYTRVKHVDPIRSAFDLRLFSPTGQVIADISDFIVLNTQAQESMQDVLTTEWNKIIETPKDFKVSSPQDPQENMKFMFVTDQDIRNNGHKAAVSSTKKGTKVDVVRELEESVTDHKTLSGVVCVCSVETDDATDSDTIQDQVVSMCCLIQTILQTMKNLSLTIPFYVCTTNAWPSTTGNAGDTKTNPMATALWGLMRTVILERVYSRVITVDLCFPSGLSKMSLPAVFCYLANTECVQGYPELRITADGVFVNQVVKDSSSPLSLHLHRLAGMNNSDGKEQGEAAKTALAIDYKQQGNDSDQTWAVLSGQEFVLGADELFNGKHLQHSEQSAPNSRLDMAAIETKGRLADGSKGDVACCCPVMIKPEIRVPAETVLPASVLPDYQLGDLTKLVVLWELRCSAHMYDMTILASSETHHLAELLKKLCFTSHEKNSQSVSIVLLEDLKHPVDFRGNVVSLVYLDTTMTSFITDHWQCAERLVTFASLMSPEAFSLMVYGRPDIKLTLLSPQTLLHPDNLKKVVPQVQSWVSANASYMEQIAKALHHTPVKGNTTDINRLFTFKRYTADTQQGTWSTEMCFKKDSAYVVVGGLTGLGWICVEFLACRGAGYIAIINRSIPAADKVAAMTSLSQKHNCQIQAYQADVTSMGSVQHILNQVGSAHFQLRGVFMGAAVLKDRSFLAMTEEDFDKVLCPKIKGAWNFHQLTKKLPLDYFVLHSSIVSILGNPGQANYVAGNAFLDGLAWYRRHQGLAAQTVNWGPLDTGLLDQQDALKKKMESAGFHISGHQEISKTLATVLHMKQSQAVPARIDPKLYARKLYATPSQPVALRFQKFASPTSVNAQRHVDSSMDVSRIKFLDPEQRCHAYERYLSEIVSHLLMVETTQMSCDIPLWDMGLDSMAGNMMLEQIQQDTTFKIEAVEVFTGATTVASLAKVLDQFAGGLAENTKSS